MPGFAYPTRYVKYIDVFRNRYFHYDRLVRIFNGLFPNGHEGRTVLDLGCGTGTFALTMADAGYQVVGIDDNEESIELARERTNGRHVRFEQRDFYDPRLGDNKFDLITQLHIPLCIDDMRSVLAGVRGYLKEDGLIGQIYLRKVANVLVDDKLDMDQYADPNGEFTIVRFNQWLLNGFHMSVFYVSLIEEDGRMRVEVDKRKLELLPKGEPLEHEFYEQVGDIPTNNSDSAPPWSEEYIQVLQHKHVAA